MKNGKDMQIYLSKKPKSSSIEEFSRFMKDKGVTDIFCFCELDYDTSIYDNYNLRFHHLEIEDGKIPNKELLEKFNKIIKSIIENSESLNINLHCQSGMGRAPTILAYLVINYCNVDNITCIEYIRRKRKGSFNQTQLEWILTIKNKKSCCLIM
jgi:protein-tyrosine phosphatase